MINESPLLSPTRVEAVFTACLTRNIVGAKILLEGVSVADQQRLRDAAKLLLAVVPLPRPETEAENG